MKIEVDPEPLRRLRTLYGLSTELWSSGEQRQISDDGWATITGLGRTDFNLALCQSDSAVAISDTVRRLGRTGPPGLIMLAGPALGHPQLLIDDGWVCVSQTAFMTKTLPAPAEPASVLAVDSNDALARCREIVRLAFGMTAAESVQALPDRLIATNSRQRLWARRCADGSITSCVCTVEVQGIGVIWYMATDPRFAGQGHAAALLDGVHAALHRTGGIRRTILTSTNSGYGLYRRTYELLERWQVWSRPRWLI